MPNMQFHQWIITPPWMYLHLEIHQSKLYCRLWVAENIGKTSSWDRVIKFKCNWNLLFLGYSENLASTEFHFFIGEESWTWTYFTQKLGENQPLESSVFSSALVGKECKNVGTTIERSLCKARSLSFSYQTDQVDQRICQSWWIYEIFSLYKLNVLMPHFVNVFKDYSTFNISKV